MSDEFIAVQDLTIGYDGPPVLTDISLRIKRGSFAAILGANGSGKSTLLKTPLGLQPPLAGRIEIGCGQRVAFGYVPQSMPFDPLYHLTGFEVALIGAYRRVRPGRFAPHHARACPRE